MTKDWNARTKLVHSGTKRSQYGEVSEAIFLTQGFVYDTAEDAEARFIETGADEYIYARYGNPTVRMFEERIAALEGCEDAFALASGMAAVNAALTCVVKAGDHIVAARALFGSCLYILEDVLGRFGVEVTLVDSTDLTAWKNTLRPDTKLVFFESVSNPTLELTDIKAVCDLAHEVGALVLVDNVFATPVFTNAFELGADIVTYSTTKHIDGGGRCLGGVVLGSTEFIRGTLEPYAKHTGGAMSPFNAWVMLKGMETLDLRCRAMATSAEYIARAIEGHEKLARVIHPFIDSYPQSDLAHAQMKRGGTMISLVLNGGQGAAFRFLNALEIVTISNNLGDAKSIVTHPATTTHQRLSPEYREELGITAGLVRLSIGIEDQEDLLRDIQQALDAV